MAPARHCPSGRVAGAADSGPAWVADGLEQHEADVLNKLTGRLPVDTGLGNLLLDLPWLPDGMTPTESRAATSLVNLWRSDPELGAVVFRLHWALDDVTEGEAAGINALANIAYSDPSLAREVLEKMEALLALPGSLAVDALVAVGQLGEFPDDLRSLRERPWFADGLEREEAAFITAIMPLAYEAPHRYAGLLESRHTLSRTISPSLWLETSLSGPSRTLLSPTTTSSAWWKRRRESWRGSWERPSLPGTSLSWLLRAAPVQKASASPGTWVPTSASPFPPVQSSQTAQTPSFMSWPTTTSASALAMYGSGKARPTS